MATANTKLTKEERETVAQGLKMLYKSAERSSKTAPSGKVREAYEAEMARVNNLAMKIHSQEIEL